MHLESTWPFCTFCSWLESLLRYCNRKQHAWLSSMQFRILYLYVWYDIACIHRNFIFHTMQKTFICMDTVYILLVVLLTITFTTTSVGALKGLHFCYWVGELGITSNYKIRLAPTIKFQLKFPASFSWCQVILSLQSLQWWSLIKNYMDS